MKLLLLSLFFVSTFSYGKNLVITSVQEKVDVFVKNSETNKLVKIGVTPLKIGYSEIVENYSRSDNFMLVMQKEKHANYRLMISKLHSGKYEINANLDSYTEKSFAKEYDLLINKLFDVQRLVRSKNYTDAITNLDSLEKDYPEVGAVYEMKAMTYYMSKDLPKSLSYYRKAASVFPGSKEVYTMKKYLESELGSTSKGIK